MFLTLLQSQDTPPPVIVITTKKSGGNADTYWLRALIQADLNTYKDKSHLQLSGVTLDCDVTVIKPVVKPDNSFKVLRTIETKLTRIIIKSDILDMYDEPDTKRNILDIYDEE